MADMAPHPQSNISILGDHPELKNYLLAAIAVPAWTSLTLYTLIIVLFRNDLAWMFFAVLTICPAIIGYAMMRSKRGALAGAAAGIALLPARSAVAAVSENVIEWALSVTPNILLHQLLHRALASVVPVVPLSAFICVGVLVLVSGYARGRAAWYGLGGGLLIGFLLCGIFDYLFIDIIGRSPQRDNLVLFLAWPVPVGLVWLSTFAAIDVASRRVGGRGPISALVLAAVLFGVSALVIK